MLVETIKYIPNTLIINEILNGSTLYRIGVSWQIQAPVARVINHLEQCSYISSRVWHWNTRSLDKNTGAHNSLDETAGEHHSLAKATYNPLPR